MRRSLWIVPGDPQQYWLQFCVGLRCAARRFGNAGRAQDVASRSFHICRRGMACKPVDWLRLPGYPQTWDSFAWGGATGIAAYLAACGAPWVAVRITSWLQLARY